MFTNSLISRTEKSPSLFVTKGAVDIIYTGKGNRYDPYDRLLLKPKVLVPKPLRFEIDERILIDGKIYNKINVSHVNYLVKKIISLNIKSVAVVLLHSYKNDIHEKKYTELTDKLKKMNDKYKELLDKYRRQYKCTSHCRGSFF